MQFLGGNIVVWIKCNLDLSGCSQTRPAFAHAAIKVDGGRPDRDQQDNLKNLDWF